MRLGKKILLGAILFALVGCSTMETSTYERKEVPPPAEQVKWIDDDDVLFVINNPQKSQWFEKIGTPLFAEFDQYETRYYYFYHPMQYKSTGSKGKVYKPDNKDRYTNNWSGRNKVVVFHMSNDNVLRVDYANNLSDATKSLPVSTYLSNKYKPSLATKSSTPKETKVESKPTEADVEEPADTVETSESEEFNEEETVSVEEPAPKQAPVKTAPDYQKIAKNKKNNPPPKPAEDVPESVEDLSNHGADQNIKRN